MNIQQKREEIFAGLELAISEILNPKQLNVWISVRERSITAILNDAGVNINFSASVMEELKKIGYIEREGNGAGMKYKIITSVIPDYKSLCEKIYNNFQERHSKKKVFDAYGPSDPSDLRPKRAKRQKMPNMNGSTKVIYREPEKLGTIGYIVANDHIQECKLIGIRYADAEFKKVLYDVEIMKNEGEEIGYETIKDICMGKFFSTPDDAAQYLIRRCVKYIKR